MTEDVSAGRLYAEVVSDTSGFARDAKRKIDAEVKALKAKIKVELDQRGLVAQARAAAKVASAAATVRLKVELDTRGIIGQAKAAALAASQAGVVKLQAELDTKAVARQAKAAAAAASGSQASVPVGADTTKADAEVDAFKQRARSKPVQIPVTADSGGLKKAATALAGLSKAPAIAGGVFLLGTAVVQLAGGLFSVVAAGSQALGVVAALPSLIGVAAQAAGALLVGFNGIGGALSAMGKAEQATTAATASSGVTAKATARAVQSASKARERAVRSVADAVQGLKDAQKSADDQAIQGARTVADARRSLSDARAQAADSERTSIENVSDAEWTLARAQEASLSAQEDLTRAREVARERIDDLNMALKQGVVDEESAAEALVRAQQKLADAKWDPSTSDADRREAETGVKQAELNVARVKDANEDLRKEAAKANKDGVEGADEVKAARDQVRDTLHAEQESAKDLAKTQADAAKSQVASARAIADAQQNLADALKAQQDGAVAAARAVIDAQRGIADAKDNLAEADRNLADASDSAAAGGTKAATALAAQEAALAKLSPAGRNFVKFLYGLKSRWLELRNATQQALLPPIQAGIKAALPILDTLQTGLVGTAKVVGGLGKDLGEALGSKNVNKDVASIMDSNNRSLGFFGKTAGSLLTILKDLAVVAGPVLVEPFAKWTATLTKGWQESITTARETGKLKTTLQQAGATAKVLADIVGNVVGALFNMGKAAAPSGQELLATLDKVTQKWQDFTASDEGQKRMQQFFEATKPVTEEIGKLVTNLVEFITKAGEGGGGSLNGFLTVLNGIFTALNKIMSVPGVAPAVGWVLALAGAGGALGLVASSVLRVGANLGKLGKFTGFSKLISGIRGAKDEIDKELPKDKAKKDALDKLDGSATKTGKSLGGKFVTGVKAASGAVVKGAKALGGWVVSMAKMGAATAATTVKLLAQKVAAVAMVVISGVAKAATIAWTLVQWLLNAAFIASPIGWIVLGIGILVAAFIFAWKHSEQFRAIVTAALNGLKVAALAVFHALGDAVQWVIGFVGDHWKLLLAILGGPLVAAVILITTHWNQIKAAFWAAVNWVIGFFQDHWKLIAGLLGGPLVAAVLLIITHWNSIKAVFWAAVNWVSGTFKKGWAAVKAILTNPVGAARDALYALLGATGLRKPFDAVVAWVKNTFSKAWSAIKKILTDPIGSAKAAIDGILGKLGLQKSFDAAVKAITTIWNKLQDAAKKPIKFIVDTVLNKGLIAGFNWIAGKVGADGLPDIPLPKGFADGGEYSGRIPGQPSNKDNLVARGPLGQRIGLATGEFIVKAKETMKNLPLLRAINEGRLSGGFADGGLFGKVKGAIGGALSKGKELGGDVLGFLGDPVKWFKDRMSGPLDRMKELGTAPATEIVKHVPRKIADVVGNKAKEILTGITGIGGGAVNPGLAGALTWAKTQIGKPYIWGGVGPDGYDCSGFMGSIVNVIRGAEDPYKRLFATASLPGGLFEQGLGAFSIGYFKGNPGHVAGTLNGTNVESRGGKGVLVGPQARGATDPLFDHVAHLKGFAKGGLFSGDAPYDLLGAGGKYRIPNADELMKSLGVTFDTGGFVEPGKPTLVDNHTGRREAMFEPDAWQGARSVLAQIQSMAKQLHTTEGTTGGRPALVGQLHVSVGDKRDLPDALDEVNHELRVIDRGGVYADSSA